jgi:hypothetical protein
MKSITVTQTYELIVTANVEVPDDYDYDNMVNAFTDFPIRVDVYDAWGDDGDIKVNGVSVDALVSLTGDGTLIIGGLDDE